MTGKPFAVNDWKNPTRPYRGHIHRQRSSAKEKNVLHTIVDRNTALSINYSESNLVKYIAQHNLDYKERETQFCQYETTSVALATYKNVHKNREI
jgi:hypothetical protein